MEAVEEPGEEGDWVCLRGDGEALLGEESDGMEEFVGGHVCFEGAGVVDFPGEH